MRDAIAEGDQLSEFKKATKVDFSGNSHSIEAC
jgi:hypothetical protein